MSLLSFLFVGRSGCGKGTQAGLLQKYILSSGQKVLYIETGAEFRSFIERQGFVNGISREVYLSDKLQPSFLACHLWTKKILQEFSGDQHMILDGVARTMEEAQNLDTAFEFLNFSKIIVVHMDVSREWSLERLKDRGRFDDLEKEKVGKRLDWFDKDVAPVIEHFAVSKKHNYIKINGEQTIEEVHQDIMNSIEPLFS